MKKCLVIRHGALGDAIMASVVLPYIHEDGYEITFMTNDRGRTVLENNPYIKHWIMHEDGSVPMSKLEDYWKNKGSKFDKVVNLTGVVENDLLFAYPQDKYFKTVRQRRAIVGNKNYYDAHIERAGYKPDNVRNAEIYFSKAEKQKGKKWRNKHKKKFRIVWSMAGSSIHKVYRYYENVAREFLARHPDAMIFTTGDYPTKLLTFEHPQIQNTMCLEISFREAMILARYSHMVIGPETGLLGAMSNFPMKKVCLLTHSGKDQLTKYWKNTMGIQAPCWCSPCHLLFKYRNIWQRHCQVNDTHSIPTPVCTEHGAGEILDIMEDTYNEFRS
jgi:ADP-heptose:LPS heptosyltransferase